MLHENTVVLTPTGFKEIKNLIIGDSVTTISGTASVLKNEKHLNVPLFRVRVEETILYCSREHTLLLFDPVKLYFFDILGTDTSDCSVVKYTDSIFEVTPILDLDGWNSGSCYSLQLDSDHNIIIDGYIISRAN